MDRAKQTSSKELKHAFFFKFVSNNPHGKNYIWNEVLFITQLVCIVYLLLSV